MGAIAARTTLACALILLATCDRAQQETFFGHCFDGALEIEWPRDATPLATFSVTAE